MGDDEADERVEEAPQHGPGAHRVTPSGEAVLWVQRERVGEAAGRRADAVAGQVDDGQVVQGRLVLRVELERPLAGPPGTAKSAMSMRTAASTMWASGSRGANRSTVSALRRAATMRRVPPRRSRVGGQGGVALPGIRGEGRRRPGGRLGRPEALEREQGMGPQAVAPLVRRVGVPPPGPPRRASGGDAGLLMAQREQAERLGIIRRPADGRAQDLLRLGPATDLE